MARHVLMACVASSVALVLATRARAQASGGRVVVSVVGLRDDRGRVGCTLYDDAHAFPTHPERARGAMFVTPQGRRAQCVFDVASPGIFAVATFHDQNGNGRMDTNFMGIPSEGTGCSNDARGRFGPPHFGDAMFVFTGGTLNVTVNMHY